MNTLLNILAGIGIIFLIISLLRWLFAPSRSHRPSHHDHAATLFFLLKDDENAKDD